MHHRSLFAVLAVIGLAFPCGATQHIVAAGGPIQPVLSAAAEGDTVLLSSGIYAGEGNRNLTYGGKDLVVMSTSDDPADCIIDCEQLGRGVLFTQQETAAAVLRGVTIRNGIRTYGGGTDGGGGICIRNQSSPSIQNCVITHCQAVGTSCCGGAVMIDSSCWPVFEDCVFSHSSAYQGGGVYTDHWSYPVFTRCVFKDNVAATRGGGLGGLAGDCHLCEFYCNTSHGSGGAVFNGDDENRYEYCTFYANAADVHGSAICHNEADDMLYLTNCLIAFNEGSEAVFCVNLPESIHVACTNIVGNLAGNWVGHIAPFLNQNGNFAADPLFCATGDCGSEDLMDLSVAHDSPCAPHFNPDCGQIGARGVGCQMLAVCSGGEYETVQDAIDAAYPGATIVLCDGIHTGPGNHDIDFHGLALTVRSESNDPSACIIDCQGSSLDPRRGFIFQSGETHTSRLMGLTIRGGYVPEDGGGVLCINASSPTIENCIFEADSSDRNGGGLAAIGSSHPLVRDCRFENCWAEWSAGGAYFHESASRIEHCDFSLCTSHHDGGAITISVDCTAEVSFCVIDSCRADRRGGGVFVEHTDFAAIVNTTIVGCACPQGAGGVHVVQGHVDVENTIIAFGTVGPAGQAGQNGSATASCCDLYQNAGGDWTGAFEGQVGLCEDPLFCGVANPAEPYALTEMSPCAPGPECGLIGALAVGCPVQSVGHDPQGQTPHGLLLASGSPNPFGDRTEIRFEIPASTADAPVRLMICDLQGRLVRTLLDGIPGPGRHTAQWDGCDATGQRVTDGVYFCSIRLGDETVGRRLLLLR